MVKKAEVPVKGKKEVEIAANSKYDFTKLNTLSVVSLATAVTGFGAVAAIITGHISLAQIKRSNENGRSLAIAGLIVGYVGLAFFMAFFYYVVIRLGLGVYMPDGNFIPGDLDGSLFHPFRGSDEFEFKLPLHN